MRAGDDRLLELAVAGFGDQHALDRHRVGLRHHVEIALRPRGDHVRRIHRIARLLEQMIGAAERHEALRMLRGGEDRARVLDADQIVGRRMHHQQRLAQVARGRLELLLRDIVEEFLADAERAARERNLDLTLRLESPECAP